MALGALSKIKISTRRCREFLRNGSYNFGSFQHIHLQLQHRLKLVYMWASLSAAAQKDDREADEFIEIAESQIAEHAEACDPVVIWDGGCCVKGSDVGFAVQAFSFPS